MPGLTLLPHSGTTSVLVRAGGLSTAPLVVKSLIARFPKPIFGWAEVRAPWSPCRGVNKPVAASQGPTLGEQGQGRMHPTCVTKQPIHAKNIQCRCEGIA